MGTELDGGKGPQGAGFVGGRRNEGKMAWVPAARNDLVVMLRNHHWGQRLG